MLLWSIRKLVSFFFSCPLYNQAKNRLFNELLKIDQINILFHKTEVRYNNVFSLASGNPSLFKERDLVRSSFFRLASLIADDKDFPIFISAIILADLPILL